MATYKWEGANRVVEVMDEKVVISKEGGMTFQTYVEGIGWVVDQDPTALIKGYAVQEHNRLFPAMNRVIEDLD